MNFTSNDRIKETVQMQDLQVLHEIIVIINTVIKYTVEGETGIW